MSAPTVTIVYLVYNRRDELRESLTRMLRDSDYPRDRVDVIVVDNASTDGSAAVVRDEFPQVRLIVRDENIGVSGWNEGLMAARGDYVLALDDDCYLSPDGLRRAVAAAEEQAADLVSFSVASTYDPDHLFTSESPMGLLSFWGCAWLVRRTALQALGGFDPEIFIWDNELELTVRFFDLGFRFLHSPDIVAHHMKPPLKQGFDERWYRANAHHFTYIATKLLRRRDAAAVVAAVLARTARDGLRENRESLRALPDALSGVVHGYRMRAPVRRPEVSAAYRNNFHGFASPWSLARPPGELVRSLPRELMPGGRRERTGGRKPAYFEERARYYPRGSATLQF